MSDRAAYFEDYPEESSGQGKWKIVLLYSLNTEDFGGVYLFKFLPEL